MFRYLAAILVGGLAMYFLAEWAGRRASGEAYGAKEKLAHMNTERPPENDVVLADRVRTEVLRDSGIPKGDVLFDVADGVVTLRGQVERLDIIEEIEARVRRVYGVRDVENLLHVPGTPAPRR